MTQYYIGNLLVTEYSWEEYCKIKKQRNEKDKKAKAV